MNIANEVRIIGHLGQNPELYTTDAGRHILKVSVATNDYYKNEKGERVESTDWHNVVFFGKRAETVSKHCKQGSQVAIVGKLKTRTYVDKKDVTHYITEIIADSVLFLDKGSK